jgi:hypothetical protein
LQLAEPPVQKQMPLMHCSPLPQRRAQAPQLFGSLLVLTHRPLQN